MSRKTTTTSVREPVGRVGQRRQVVIPRNMLETLQLQEGDFVAFTQQANGVLIRPKRLVDPDDVLTPNEAVLLKKAEQQMRGGQSVNLAELQHELARKPRARGRKTA
jgi:bifunctional DNA-binding transcriptional regulator/antitoxin component of YhaV-PrlF toxin-antitoxin module